MIMLVRSTGRAGFRSPTGMARTDGFHCQNTRLVADRQDCLFMVRWNALGLSRLGSILNDGFTRLNGNTAEEGISSSLHRINAAEASLVFSLHRGDLDSQNVLAFSGRIRNLGRFCQSQIVYLNINQPCLMRPCTLSRATAACQASRSLVGIHGQQNTCAISGSLLVSAS